MLASELPACTVNIGTQFAPNRCADQNLKAKRQTASETLEKVVLDCRKRFSSFTPTDQNQYRKGVSSLINTVLPVWLKLRNTYINISK